MEWVESTGASIDEAKELALDRLGVHEDDAEFEVLADVKTGLFGRVKEEARVRARVRPTTPRAKDDRRRGRKRGKGSGKGSGGGADKGADKGSDKGSGQRSGKGSGKGSSSDAGRGRGSRDQGSKDRESKSRESNGRRAATSGTAAGGGTQREKKDTMDDDTPTMTLTEQADLAEEFVRGLAERFGTTVTFERTQAEEDEIRIMVSGDELGRMIGRRGTTAMAIDDLVRTVLQRHAGSSRNGRVRVDVGGVQARRAEALGAFAREQAAAVRASGAPRALEPMSSADRKTVHDALTEEDGVDTISEGEDAQRRVVIVPAATDG